MTTPGGAFSVSDDRLAGPLRPESPSDRPGRGVPGSWGLSRRIGRRTAASPVAALEQSSAIEAVLSYSASEIEYLVWLIALNVDVVTASRIPDPRMRAAMALHTAYVGQRLDAAIAAWRCRSDYPACEMDLDELTAVLGGLGYSYVVRMGERPAPVPAPATSLGGTLDRLLDLAAAAGIYIIWADITWAGGLWDSTARTITLHVDGGEVERTLAHELGHAFDADRSSRRAALPAELFADRFAELILAAHDCRTVEDARRLARRVRSEFARRPVVAGSGEPAGEDLTALLLWWHALRFEDPRW